MRLQSAARDELTLPEVADDADLGGLPLVFQTLGAARLMLGDDRIVPSTGTLFALLVRVAYSPEYRHSRDELLTSLWPGQSIARQRGNLRQTLYKARSMGINVSLMGDCVCLDPRQVVTTFSLSHTPALFDRDVVRGNEPFGVFLPSFVAPWPDYQEWVDAQRATVHAAVRRVLVELLRTRRERADWSGAEALARWLLQFDPLHEEATLTLAECTMLAGSKAEAVAIIDRYLAEIGPSAGDIRLPATLLRKRFTEPPTKKRPSFVPAERHFVGRTTELANLTMAMRRARWHDGSAVMIEGYAGIGKTRLANELSKVSTIEGFREIRVECRDGDVNRPLHALLEPVTELLTLPGALGCAPESMSILRKIVGISDAELSRTEGDASSTSAAARSLEGVDLTSIRSQTVRHSIIDLIGAVTEEKPLFLIIEDAHWIDDDSWDVLVDLAESVALMRVFLVITTRPPARRVDRSSKSPSALQVVKLDALLPEESLSLARWLSSEMAAPLSPKVEDWIVSASEGSPFFLLALVNHWVETGDASGIPPTLQGLLDQRIERLPSTAVRALQTISLLGEYASLDRIMESLQLPTHELLAALEQLEKEGYLAQDEAALVVSHELVGKAATSRMSTLVRAALRSSIAEAFEREFDRTADVNVLLQGLHQTELSGRGEAVLRFLVKHAHSLVESGRPRGLLQTLNRATSARALVSTATDLRWLQARLELDSGEYAKFLALGPNELKLPTDIASVTHGEAEEALSIVDSAYRADPFVDKDGLVEFTLRLVNSLQLPRSTRLRAAEIGLVICSNTCDSMKANSIFQSISPTDKEIATDDRIQRMALLYHTIFGSLDIAELVAQSLYSKSLRQAASTTSYQDAGRAAFTLRMCGKTALAIEAFNYSYRTAIEIDAPRLAQFPAWQLANLYLEMADEPSANDWTSTLAKLFESEEDEVSSSFVIAYFCRVAIYNRDIDGAIELLERCKRAYPRFPTVKAHAYVVALEIGTQLLNPTWIPSDALLEVASARHESTARFGTSDFLSTVYFSALQRAGRLEEAREKIVDYTNSLRRDRSPLAVSLLHLKSNLSG
ncbi:AAA family ATPase [Gemmatimonas groenlandica]|uniref:AAA family ATPase n=2 Tax=Gemmatimonas groenlandica TaxID=2732249 RepID=A0A6M4ILU3_9BACT|nr:AAA family ATPase [Gemmatimonas groenlandica]